MTPRLHTQPSLYTEPFTLPPRRDQPISAKTTLGMGQREIHYSAYSNLFPLDDTYHGSQSACGCLVQSFHSLLVGYLGQQTTQYIHIHVH